MELSAEVAVRLFDKTLTLAPKIHRDGLAALSRAQGFATVIVDNIAADYYASRQDWFESKDYPYFVLPWKIAFIEWHEPPGISTQCGAIAMSFDDEKAISAWVRFINTVGDKQITREPVKDATRVVSMMPVAWSASVGIKVVEVHIVAFTTPEGFVVKRAVFGHALKPFFEQSPENPTAWFDSVLHICALSCTFMNCKNTRLKDCPDFAPSDKIRRRLKIPDVKRYTLEINGMLRPRDAGVSAGDHGIAYHLCRGHFATYTEEKPLFGKHVGKFWIPPHTKGKRERGIVEKDYSIGTPN